MNTFELETIEKNTDGSIIEIKDFEQTLENAREIVNNNPVFIITNDSEKKEAKAIRANLNKVIKAINQKRINDVNNLVSLYESQCKEIVEIFDKAQKEFGEQIKTYEDKVKEESTIVSQEAKQFTATITFTDSKMVDKLISFCEKNNLTITIK